MNKVNTMIKILRTEKGMNQEQLLRPPFCTRQSVAIAAVCAPPNVPHTDQKASAAP